MHVKICGIRCVADALMAADLGADAIGVLVGQRHPSGDFITADQAQAILRALPSDVSGVLVSHWSDPEALVSLIDQIKPTVVQLHSTISPAEVTRLRQARPHVVLLKAVHGNSNKPLEAVKAQRELVDGFVVDSCNPTTGQVGGTGLTHDWSISAQLVQQLDKPLWLAGGLTPTNVVDAIRTVQPWGVDVNSGVKAADGFKDPLRLEAFIRAAKGTTDDERSAGGMPRQPRT